MIPSAASNNEPPDSHRDLMVDIETLGTKPGCVVLSAAGVWFDRDFPTTYVAFNDTYAIQDMLECGLEIDPPTAKWWFEQDGFRAMAKRMEVTTSLADSRMKIREALERSARIWACGPDFDPPILSRALQLDWPFWKNRDVRTMRDYLGGYNKDATHDPLQDCDRQIIQVREAHHFIKSRLAPASMGNMV